MLGLQLFVNQPFTTSILKGHLLRHKMISKIQLIGNKEVTLLVKLNR